MPFKNKEDYNRYMREYRKRKNVKEYMRDYRAQKRQQSAAQNIHKADVKPLQERTVSLSGGTILARKYPRAVSGSSEEKPNPVEYVSQRFKFLGKLPPALRKDGSVSG